MERLTADFRFDAAPIEEKLKRIAGELAKKDYDAEAFREKVISAGFTIKRLSPILKKKSSFLAVDSSIVKKELRQHALWATHCVVLYSEFDGKAHQDPLAQGLVSYGNLMYDSYLDLGVFSPYRHIESRANSLRVANEYASLILSYKRSGLSNVDYFLVDGSLQTTVRRLKDEVRMSKFPEHSKALNLHNELLSVGKVIGLVEDSHSCDLSKKIGLEVTNSTLMDIILADNEYVAFKKDDINVCHLKLPAKALNYTHSRKSSHIVVRWEFSYDDYEADLGNLAALWAKEDDIFHTQIYPMRVTDYLTRRLKVGGMLDSLIEESGLEPLYRDMREA
jgi:hypothetical protein